MKKKFLGFYKEIYPWGENLLSIKEVLSREKKQNSPKALEYLQKAKLRMTSRDRSFYIEKGEIPPSDVYADREWMWTGYYIEMAKEGFEVIPSDFIKYMELHNFIPMPLDKLSEEEQDIIDYRYYNREYLD